MVIVPACGRDAYWWPSIAIGDVVNLQQDSANSLQPAVVAAYHNGALVGHLSGEAPIPSLAGAASDRTSARVVGQIVDEEGGLVGLDVELLGEESARPQDLSRRSFLSHVRKRTARAASGIIGFVLALAVMAEVDSSNPMREPPGQTQSPGSGRSHKLVVEQQVSLPVSPNASQPHGQRVPGIAVIEKQFGQVSAPATKSNAIGATVQHKSGIDHQAQRSELWRRIEEAAAWRVAWAHSQKAEAAELHMQSELRQARQMVEQISRVSAQLRKQLAEKERRAQELIFRKHAQIYALESRLALINRHNRLTALASQPVEDETARTQELQDIDVRELQRHRNHVTAWKLKPMEPARPAQNAGDERKRASPVNERERASPVNERERASPEKKIVVQSEKSKKDILQTPTTPVRKKANFSRYTLENSKLNSNVR